LNVFYGAGVTVTVEDSLFRGNRSARGGAIGLAPSGRLTVRTTRFEANHSDGEGGAVIVESPNAQVDISDSQFVRNNAVWTGGAICAASPTITRVTFTENSAGHQGGALDSYDGVLTIADSTFTGNTARRAGAISSLGQVQISGSTFTGNIAHTFDTGAILLDDRTGLSRIVNSTLSGNQAVSGGTAITIKDGAVTLVNDTITRNTTTGGGGVAILAHWNTPVVRMANTIVAGNATDGVQYDIYVDGRPGGLVSLGHNVVGTNYTIENVAPGPGDQIGTPAQPLDPGLLPLANNGGLTRTHALAATSPARDAGSPDIPGDPGACLAVDQRGSPRPGYGTQLCDAGAFEHQEPVPLTLHVGAGGSVVGLSGETACTNDCAAFFDFRTVVKIEARPSPGASFVGWAGGCTGTSAICFVTMDGAKTVAATFHVDSVASTTTLTSTSNPSVHLQPVTFTATVAAASPTSAHPTGSVQFLDITAATTLGFGALDAAGVATLPVSLPYGSHSIKAIYTGDGIFTASSGTLDQIVNRANTAVTLTSSGTPSVVGQAVTFTASVSAVSPGSGTPAGTATFKDLTTNTTLGTVALNVAGAANLTTSALAAGLHQIQASYRGVAGDPTPLFEQSESAILQMVEKAPTKTTVTTSAETSLAGRAVTLTATITVENLGAAPVTGAVTFLKDKDATGAPLGSATVGAGGVAILETTTLPEGAYTIRARYEGNASLLESSGTVAQTILPAIVPLDIDEHVVVSDAVVPLASEMLTVSERVIVSDAVTPLASEMLTIAETVIVVDTPAPVPQSNTTPGTNVSVSPTGGGVSLTFAGVTAGGFTSVTAITGPPPPAGFKLTSPSTVFEIATTAKYSSPITICISYPTGTRVPRLMHYESGRWVDRTTSVNTTTRTVCGSVTSLSPFAVFEAEDVEGRMHGSGSLAGGEDFTFHVAELTLGDERGSLVFTRRVAKSGKQKAQDDEFRADAIGAIVFWNNSAALVFSGTGKWNGLPGYSFEAEASDQGEPGRGRDTFSITIRAPGGAIAATANGVISNGNIQSKRMGQR
jgi:predicted outer membrane repeat protein